MPSQPNAVPVGFNKVSEAADALSLEQDAMSDEANRVHGRYSHGVPGSEDRVPDRPHFLSGRAHAMSVAVHGMPDP